jgi:hypothetical protein
MKTISNLWISLLEVVVLGNYVFTRRDRCVVNKILERASQRGCITLGSTVGGHHPTTFSLRASPTRYGIHNRRHDTDGSVLEEMEEERKMTRMEAAWKAKKAQ